MLSATRSMLRVRCGWWQSRQTVAHAPYFVLVVSDECALIPPWQSEQSWLELSRTSRLPSPLRDGPAVTRIAPESVVSGTEFTACARRVCGPGGGAGTTISKTAALLASYRALRVAV